MGIVIKKRKTVSSSLSPGHFNPTTGAYSIGLYLANKEPFRVAPTSGIPVPQPYDSRECSEEAYNIEEDLHGSITDAAMSFGITCQSMSTQKLWKRGFPNTAKDTLVISTSDTDTTRWEAAANDIYDMVEKTADSAGIKMEVEIQNPSEVYSDVSSPIRDDDNYRVPDMIEPAFEAEVDKTAVPRGQVSRITVASANFQRIGMIQASLPSSSSSSQDPGHSGTRLRSGFVGRSKKLRVLLMLKLR